MLAVTQRTCKAGTAPPLRYHRLRPVTIGTTVSAPTPNCNACAHFYITHDATFPYGCHKLGFKSKRLPQYEVLASSGLPCLVFQPKGRRRAPPR